MEEIVPGEEEHRIRPKPRRSGGGRCPERPKVGRRRQSRLGGWRWKKGYEITLHPDPSLLYEIALPEIPVQD